MPILSASSSWLRCHVVNRRYPSPRRVERHAFSAAKLIRHPVPAALSSGLSIPPSFSRLDPSIRNGTNVASSSLSPFVLPELPLWSACGVVVGRIASRCDKVARDLELRLMRKTPAKLGWRFHGEGKTSGFASPPPHPLHCAVSLGRLCPPPLQRLFPW